MTLAFPVVVCLVGAAADFAVWQKLRHFRVREKAPTGRDGFSLEERQKRVTIATSIVFSSGWFLLGGAILLLWLGNSK